MKTINEALDATEKALEIALQDTVTMNTLRAIFDNSLLRVVRDMEESFLVSGKAFYVNDRALEYLNGKGLNLNCCLFSAGYIDDREMYYGKLDSTNYFFWKYKIDSEYDYCIEVNVAKLAFMLPPYGYRRREFNDEALMAFFAKSLNLECWSVYDDAKVAELTAFIVANDSSDFSINEHASPPHGANAVYEAENYKALYDYICSEFKSNRSSTEMFWFMQSLICWMCPDMSMSFDRDDESVDIYYEDGCNRIRGAYLDLKAAFLSDRFMFMVNENYDSESLLIPYVLESYIEE